MANTLSNQTPKCSRSASTFLSISFETLWGSKETSFAPDEHSNTNSISSFCCMISLFFLFPKLSLFLFEYGLSYFRTSSVEYFYLIFKPKIYLHLLQLKLAMGFLATLVLKFHLLYDNGIKIKLILGLPSIRKDNQDTIVT